MKRFFAVFLSLVCMFSAAFALAAGNVTIAVYGQNDFDENIASMFIRDGKLMLLSWTHMYEWTPETGELKQIEGYEAFNQRMNGSMPAEEDENTLQKLLGLEPNQSAYAGDQIYCIGDKLYRMAQIYTTLEEEEKDSSYECETAFVEMCIAEDGTLSLGDVIEMGDALTIDYGDGYQSVRDISNPCVIGEKLYALTYSENGREMIVIDFEDATVESMALDTDLEINQIAAFDAQRMLLVGMDYAADPVVPQLMLYDPQSEALTELGEMPAKQWQAPAGICYDEARGMIYYALSGSVWRMHIGEDGLGTPEEFGDMPLETYYDMGAVMMGDWYIVSSYDGVIGRDVTREKLPEERLNIKNGSYIGALKQAYYPFTDAHPEYIVSIDNSLEPDSLLSDMLNRSSETDIYTMDSVTGVYDALINRGFMAELDASDKLAQGADAMYDFVRNHVEKDGHLYAMPLYSYGDILRLNTKVLTEKLGFTQDELPATWPEMFAMVAKLSDGRMQEAPEITLFGPGYIKEEARRELFMCMLNDFFLWMDQDENNMARSADVLVENLHAFETIDWDGFGMPEEYEDGAWEWVEENIVLYREGLSLNAYYDEEGGKTYPLAMTAGEVPKIGIELGLAFVNPFSKHREEAIEYLEQTWDFVEKIQKMSLMPDLNERVENKYYKETLANLDEMIASAEKGLQKTENEEEKERYTNQIEELKQQRKEYETEYRYDVDEEDIARYRALDDMFAVRHVTIWNGDGEETISQYLDGAITAQQLADALGKTLQMQRLEGN